LREGGTEERKIFIDPQTVSKIKQKIDEKNEEYSRDESKNFAERFNEQLEKISNISLR